MHAVLVTIMHSVEEQQAEIMNSIHLGMTCEKAWQELEITIDLSSVELAPHQITMQKDVEFQLAISKL